MALVDEIAAYLQAQSVGTVGTDIFKGRMPDTPDAAVAIIPYPGLPPEHTLGIDNARQLPRFQVVARATTYSAAYAKAHAIWQVLTFTNQTLSSVRYLRCEPLQSEFSTGRDENDRTELKCNYQVMKEVS